VLLLALAASEEWPCALEAGVAVLALLVEDAAVVVVELEDGATADDDEAFDRVATTGFKTVGLELAVEIAPINIAHSSSRETRFTESFIGSFSQWNRCLEINYF
jgi:hypothetical protein